MLEADTPRVKCRTHGVVVGHVLWARHDAGHTLAFDDQDAQADEHGEVLKIPGYGAHRMT